MAASYRALRPLRIVVASFVSAIISATVFPFISFCVCVLLFHGYLSGPYIYFLSALIAIGASVNGRACVGGGRVGGINKGDGIIKIETRSLIYIA